jgi:hypothetical protein
VATLEPTVGLAVPRADLQLATVDVPMMSARVVSGVGVNMLTDVPHGSQDATSRRSGKRPTKMDMG